MNFRREGMTMHSAAFLSWLPLVLPFGALTVYAVYALLHSKAADQWRADSAAPVQTVSATVVSTDRRKERFSNGRYGDDYYYYATFRLNTGEEMELSLILHQGDYRKLTPGDYGQLTYQGQRYVSFARWDAEA